MNFHNILKLSLYANLFLFPDYMGENVMLLLQRLDRKDLRGICDKFRLKKTIKTKEEMVKCLLKYSNTQSSLTIHKSTKDLLMEEVQRRMGRCMRVSEAFRNAFDSMYMLGTFTNPKFKKVEDYFKLYPKVIFPTFPIDEYTIFSSRSDFIGYVYIFLHFTSKDAFLSFDNEFDNKQGKMLKYQIYRSKN